MKALREAVEARDLQAIEALLAVGPDGLIDDFMVMVRPLSGLSAFASAMGARLSAPEGSR